MSHHQVPAVLQEPCDLPAPSMPPDCDHRRLAPHIFRMWRNAPWVMTVVLLDPTQSTPTLLPISDDTTVEADLYLRGQATPVRRLTAANDGVLSLDRTQSQAVFLVGTDVTATARLEPDRSFFASLFEDQQHGPHHHRHYRDDDFATRLVVWTVSSATGLVIPAAVCGIIVGDLAKVPPEYFQKQQIAYAFGAVTNVIVNNLLPLRSVSLKRAMNAWQAGSVQAMYESGVIDIAEGSDTSLTWHDPFAPLGGPLDALVLQWLQLPAGANLSLSAATARLAALRIAAASL